MTPLLTLDVIFGASALYIFYRFLHARNQTLPPGPIGLPLVGNILNMPTSYEHLTFAKWGERWGTYSHLEKVLHC